MKCLNRHKMLLWFLLALFSGAGVFCAADFHQDFSFHDDCPLCRLSVDGVSFSPDFNGPILFFSIPTVQVPAEQAAPFIVDQSHLSFSLRAPPIS